MEGKIKIDYFLFFSVLASSMIGAQFLGVSLSKISLIPLELYLIICFWGKKTHLNKIKKVTLCWFGLIFVSSLFNVTFCEILEDEYFSVLLFNMIQVVLFHVPLLFLFDSVDSAFIKFKKCVLIVAKINCIWCIIQFIAWAAFSFDFNNFVFIHLLHGALGDREWTAWTYETNLLALRPTGLNRDPAFLALLLVFGFALTKSIFWKCLFFGGTVVAMSRVGIVSIVFFILFEKYQQGVFKVNVNRAALGVLPVILFSVCAIWLYNNTDYANRQMNIAYSRFENMIDRSSSGAGSDRHLFYIPASILTSIELPLANQILGIGPRTGGAAFHLTESYKSFFTLNDHMMKKKVWAIECDPAELLLGCGFIGFVLYYFMMFSFARKYRHDLQDCFLFVMIPVFGVMYDISMHPLITLLLIVATQPVCRTLDNESSKNRETIAFRRQIPEEMTIGTNI